MIRYLITRLLLAIPTLLAVFTIVFLVIRIVPGDPATAALGDYASQDAVEALRERMGLNDPIPVQYADYLGNLLRGDLGTSMINGKSISEQIAYVLPYTLQLTAASVLFGTLLGVPLGVLTALKRNSAADYLGRVFSLAGLSIPAFYLAILLIFTFAVRLGWLPAIGGGDIYNDPIGSLRYLVLPTLTLGLIMTASVTRLTRSTMLNVLREDYVRTAQGQGAVQVGRDFRPRAPFGMAAHRRAAGAVDGQPDRRLRADRVRLLTAGAGQAAHRRHPPARLFGAAIDHGGLCGLCGRRQPVDRPDVRIS